MKRVVCINDDNQLPNAPHVRKGVIYTVVGNVKIPGRDFYFLLEIGNRYAHFVDCFIDIIENQIDETELALQREQDEVKI